MADSAVKEEKSWWDSFVEGVSELGSTYLNYDIAKTKASNSTVDTTPVTTYPQSGDNTNLLLVGGAALILVVLLVARK